MKETVTEIRELNRARENSAGNPLPKHGLSSDHGLHRESKFVSRLEKWGKIHYNFELDQFSAEVHSEDRLVPYSPLAIYWLIIAPCNLKCIHCYGNVEDLPRQGLDSAGLLQVADRIIESGAMRVTLNGGEPLLHRAAPVLIEKLADHDISVVVGTNGTHVRAPIIKSLIKTNLVEISFDSFDKQTNDFIRANRIAGQSAFDDALKAINICLDNQISIRVLTCLNTFNYQQLEATADLLYSRGVRDWSVSWTLNAGRARFRFQELNPQSPQAVEQAIVRIREKYKDLRIKYSNRSDHSKNNRYSCLVFPDGRMFAEDLQIAKKFAFHSLLEGPVSQSWTDENYDREGHLQRWIAGRLYVGN